MLKCIFVSRMLLAPAFSHVPLTNRLDEAEPFVGSQYSLDWSRLFPAVYRIRRYTCSHDPVTYAEPRDPRLRLHILHPLKADLNIILQPTSNRNRDISVGIVGYWLDDRGIGLRFPTGAEISFSA
jgi:hypothetical protein